VLSPFAEDPTPPLSGRERGREEQRPREGEADKSHEKRGKRGQEPHRRPRGSPGDRSQRDQEKAETRWGRRSHRSIVGISSVPVKVDEFGVALFFKVTIMEALDHEDDSFRMTRA